MAKLHETVVCLVGGSEDYLCDLIYDFMGDSPYVFFREPDLDNAVTAIACIPDEDLRRVFRRLPLDDREGVKRND